LCDQIYFIQNAEGGALGPFDCWLCLRGLKTMSLRMERQAANCKRMAEWLAAHPLVTKVNYAGMAGTPDAALHWQQATGEGSLLSFTTDDIDVSKMVVTETKLFKITVSFGNVNSLISLPCYMSHASIPAEVRQRNSLTLIYTLQAPYRKPRRTLPAP
jgi:cystathionine beta-lyase